MDETKWMIITYYCPTHGNSDLVKPSELTKNEIRKKGLKRDRFPKN